MIFELWILSFGAIGWWIADLVIEFKNRPKKQKFMNSKAALCMVLLRGEVVSIRTGFLNLSITNVPREIGRSIERSFGVVVSRVRKEGHSKYGVPCTWHEYRLNKSPMNEPGILKMKEYVKKHLIENPKTDKEAKLNKQMQMSLY